MSRLVFTAAVCVVFVASVVLVNGKNKCPFALGKYPFDAAKFAGEWNLIAATPYKKDIVYRCGKGSMTAPLRADESSTSRYTARSPEDDKPIAIEVVAQGYKEMSAMGVVVYRKEGTDKWSDVYKQSIIATDYTSYALSLACKTTFDETTKSFGRHLIAEIWSRNETLSQDVMDTLISVSTSYDIDPKTIQKVDRSNCN